MALRIRFLPLLASVCWIGTATGARAQSVVDVYAAGSLRGAVTALATQAAAMGIQIKPTFGGSGLLRDQIEKGAKPDLLLSADMASPDALARERRAILPAIAFARNRMCLLARRTLGITAGNMVDRLLSKGVRIRTSHPVADPSGDYAMAMFDLIDRAHPGAGAALRANAERQWTVPAPPPTAGRNAMAALFEAQRIDVAVTYCSATADVTASLPDVESIAVPAAFDPHPLFGLALLSDNGAAARFALLLLAPAGQSAIAGAGLLPISETRP